MSGHVAIYLRNEDLIVVPQGGGGGYAFDIEPVHVVKPDESAAAEAIESALRDSKASTLQEPVGKKSPALDAVKARSWKAFYKNASYCYVYEDQGTLYLQNWRPARDGRGFEFSGEAPTPIPDPTQAGRVVLEWLKSAPRMP